MADFGIVVHRDRLNNTVEIRVEKVKFKHLGSAPGIALMKYNLNNGRYTPYYAEQELQWDNSNHLVEEAKQLEEDAAEAAKFDFDSWLPERNNEVPF